MSGPSVAAPILYAGGLRVSSGQFGTATKRVKRIASLLLEVLFLEFAHTLCSSTNDGLLKCVPLSGIPPVAWPSTLGG